MKDRYLITTPLPYNHHADTNTHKKYFLDALAAYATDSTLESGLRHAQELLTKSLVKNYSFTKEEAMELSKILELEYKRIFRVDTQKNKHKNTPKINRHLLTEAIKNIHSKINLNTSYTIPALAGYGCKQHKNIYFDKDFATFMKNSKKRSLENYLIVHEIIEKALMLVSPFKHRLYQRTHQIAQRIEKFLLINDGHSWSQYQHNIMKKYIYEADQNILDLSLPKDFDVQPYIDYLDFAVVEANNKLNKISPQRYTLYHLGYVEEIIPKVYRIVFNNKTVMARTMLRFQEHYESPEWADKIFTLQEFRNKYLLKTKEKKFTYYKEWSYGFNIPSSVFKKFYDKSFDPLTINEQIILYFFRFKQKQKFYVIATSIETAAATDDHEIAHAFYFLYPKYKEEVMNILKKCDLAGLKKLILKHNLDYHDKVMDDEAQAWLMWSYDWLQKYGIEEEKYAQTREKLLAIYHKYKKIIIK